MSTDNRNAWKAPRKSLCITQLSFFFFRRVDRGLLGPHLESEDVKFVGKHPPPPVAFFGVRQTGGESCARVSVGRPHPTFFFLPPPFAIVLGYYEAARAQRFRKWFSTSPALTTTVPHPLVLLGAKQKGWQI